MSSILCCPVLTLTSSFVTLSFRECSFAICDEQHSVFSLVLLLEVIHDTAALYRRVDRIIASYNLIFTFRLIHLLFPISFSLYPTAVFGKMGKQNDWRKQISYWSKIYMIMCSPVTCVKRNKRNETRMRGKAQREGRPSVTQFSYHVPTSSCHQSNHHWYPMAWSGVLCRMATAVLPTWSSSICLQLTINTCRLCRVRQRPSASAAVVSVSVQWSVSARSWRGVPSNSQ